MLSVLLRISLVVSSHAAIDPPLDVVIVGAGASGHHRYSDPDCRGQDPTDCGWERDGTDPLPSYTRWSELIMSKQPICIHFSYNRTRDCALIFMMPTCILFH